MSEQELTTTQLEFRIRYEVRRGDDPHDVAEKYSVDLERVLLLTAPPLPAKQLAQLYTNLAIRTLVRIATDPAQDGTAQQKAAEALLNRGWGKAEQSVTVDQKTAITVNVKYSNPAFNTGRVVADAVELAPRLVTVPAPAEPAAVEATPWREPAPDPAVALEAARLLADAREGGPR